MERQDNSTLLEPPAPEGASHHSPQLSPLLHQRSLRSIYLATIMGAWFSGGSPIWLKLYGKRSSGWIDILVSKLGSKTKPVPMTTWPSTNLRSLRKYAGI